MELPVTLVLLLGPASALAETSDSVKDEEEGWDCADLEGSESPINFWRFTGPASRSRVGEIDAALSLIALVDSLRRAIRFSEGGGGRSMGSSSGGVSDELCTG